MRKVLCGRPFSVIFASRAYDIVQKSIFMDMKKEEECLIKGPGVPR